MNKRFLCIILFIISFSVSCNRFSDKKFYFENIKNDSYFIEILNSRNKEFNYEFIKANNENPPKVAYWKNNFDRNNLKADSLFQIIENIKLSKFENLDFSELNFDELKKIRNIKITDIEKNLLYNEITLYSNMIEEIMPDTSTLFHIDFIFKDENVKNALNLFSKKTNGLQFLAVLSKIEVFIKNSQVEFNQYLFMNVDGSSFKFYKLSAFCIPFSKTVFLGNDYNSKIIFGSEDTTRTNFIVIDNDTVETNQGIYIFKEKARTDSGKVSIDAKFLMERPYDGAIIEYPFKIEYEVIK